MSINKGFYNVIVFIIFIISSLSSYSQGLFIKGNTALIDERSSYNVFANTTPVFKDLLSIEFSIIPSRLSARGGIVRIKNDEANAVYNVSYNGRGSKYLFKLNLEGQNALISIPIDKETLNDNQWVKLHVKFDMVKDLVTFSINGIEEVCGLELEEDKWTPHIYFGRSEHVIDVLDFELCNLTVKDNEKEYCFPLNESEGEVVHDSNRKEIGRVSNPVWLINDAYYWKKGPEFSSKEVAGSNFNSNTQDVYYFNKDSIFIYNTQTKKSESFKYANSCPMQMRLGTNFLDVENKRLYIYEVADPPQGDIVIAYLDLETLSWNTVSSEVLPMQLHHHSNYMDDFNRRYIIFGGFGGTSYFNNFYSFSLDENRWSKMKFTGDTITPRYFTSMGYNASDGNLYVFGGMGNMTGDQTVGRVYYYELYRINLNKKSIEKLWEIRWNKENVVPVRNLIFTSDNHFYTLCYPEHFSHSHLKLYRFSIADGGYEILGDSIPVLSEKITTNVNMYYDLRSKELLSLVQEFDYDDVASTAKIYTLSFPPVSKEELTLYNVKPSSGGWIKWLSGGLVAVSLLVFLFIKRNSFRQRSRALLKKYPLDKQKIVTVEHPVEERNNSIYLFGEFSMIDRNNRQINYLLSAKLRQAFFLILYHSLKKGITSQEFSEYLWPSKSYEKSKNSRGVTLNNLRKILNDLDGITLLHEKGLYKIVFAKECYCDYLRCLDIVTGTNMENNMDEFVSIISRGKFLKTEDVELLDPFKEYIEHKIGSAMYFYMEKSYAAGNYPMTISLCESMFNLDPLDENALQYLIKSFTKLESKDEAKHRYYLFAIDYKKTLGEEYNKSFIDLLK